MNNNKTKEIKVRPWINGDCDKCKYLFDGDMCGGFHFGMSNGYCPAVIECDCYNEK